MTADPIARATRALTLAQGAAFAVSGVALTMGPLTLIACGHGGGWAGALVGAFGLAGGLGAALAGRGVARRPWAWLGGGHAVSVAGGASAMAAAAAGSAAGIVAAVALMGAGQGAALMGRAVVAALHPPGRRGRAAGRVLAAGAVGAVAGPGAVAAGRAAAGTAGLDPGVAPWALVMLLGLAGLAAVRRAGRGAPAPSGAAPADAARTSAARTAIVALVAAQATMVGAMAVAPGRVHAMTGSAATVSVAVALHLTAMYALAPAVGRLIDRRGHLTGIRCGALASVAAAALVAAPAPAAVVGGLALAGVAWSGAYLSATASLGGGGRSGTLGAVDLCGAAAGAVAAAAAGLAAGAGPPVLGVLLAAPALLALGAALTPAGRPPRAAPDGAPAALAA